MSVVKTEILNLVGLQTMTRKQDVNKLYSDFVYMYKESGISEDGIKCLLSNAIDSGISEGRKEIIDKLIEKNQTKALIDKLSKSKESYERQDAKDMKEVLRLMSENPNKAVGCFWHMDTCVRDDFLDAFTNNEKSIINKKIAIKLLEVDWS